ncbi:unnamed protein product [Acanthoscelides obtectus]|uniref:MADF domain-containing protein n=1 Tax=Acanthoscelides obtectus TaxID=200917 RepID=A0A9P0QB99_ACAOB|nr:unnamed protein product [Acanthoscelides obtectus]CAK1683551.1 hypothetical protein AOBTE_LOCUS34308 [Acanthoscelides obtectus]
MSEINSQPNTSKRHKAASPGRLKGDRLLSPAGNDLLTLKERKRVHGRVYELYKSFPCLWKVKSKQYSDRNAKSKAYDILVEKMRTVEESANREIVVKKINSLRTTYREELKKVLDSERSGVGTDDVYVPHLWYFELLSFLRDQESPRTSVSNMEDDNETQNSETHGVQSEDNSSQPATPHSIISEPLTPRPIPQATSRAAKMRNDKCDEVLDVTQKRFTMPSDVDAKFTLIGKAWTCKLKELSQVQATPNSKSLLYLAYTTSIIQSANSTVFTTRVIIKSSNHAIFGDASFTNRTIL